MPVSKPSINNKETISKYNYFTIKLDLEFIYSWIEINVKPSFNLVCTIQRLQYIQSSHNLIWPPNNTTTIFIGCTYVRVKMYKKYRAGCSVKSSTGLAWKITWSHRNEGDKPQQLAIGLYIIKPLEQIFVFFSFEHYIFHILVILFNCIHLHRNECSRVFLYFINKGIENFGKHINSTNILKSLFRSYSSILHSLFISIWFGLF